MKTKLKKAFFYILVSGLNILNMSNVKAAIETAYGPQIAIEKETSTIIDYLMLPIFLTILPIILLIGLLVYIKRKRKKK